MKRVGVLPTLVTLANGYCGLLAIFKIHDGSYYTASYLILIAMIFDMLDGKVARIAGISSRFGAQLDSLSDAISFGVAPAFLAKAVVEHEFPGVYPPKVLTLLVVIFGLGALLRLARYNVEHASGEGSDSEGKGVSVFDGIPTPGAAGVIASIVFLAEDPSALLGYRFLYAILPVLASMLGVLMITRLPYVHFGSRFLQGRRDFPYVLAVVVAALILLRFPHEGCAIGFVGYLLSGPVLRLFRKKTQEQEQEEEEEEEEPVRIPDGL